MTSSDEMVFYEGPRHRVVGLVRKGKCEVDEYLRDLPTKTRAHLRASFRMLCTSGRLRTPERFREIKGLDPPPVYEFKAPGGPGIRLYAVRIGNDYVITHGRSKPKDKLVKSEGLKTQRLIKDTRVERAE